jgi:alpha-ketoglutarate-dependent taurine dioxygenase
LLPEEKAELEGLTALHTVEASMRPVFGQFSEDELQRFRAMGAPMQHPIVWTHASGRKSLVIGTHAAGVTGMPEAAGRALLARLVEWAAQPDFTYRHHWQEGDFVIWDNCGAMHRVIPYPEDSGRTMHRTSILGEERINF